MSRVYAQQKRPGAKTTEPSYSAPAVHAPSIVSGQSNSDLDAMMQAKFQQHFLDNQIPTAEAEADRIAASVSGARTPDEVKTQLGEKMGADFSNVTFHTDSAALKQADAMGARAYTSGSDVYFGSGGFDPGVAAHELVHTVQQGMVGSAMQTTSAPTGGVQMMPKWLKNLFGKKPTEEEKARQLHAAEDMMQDVINRGDYKRKNFQKDADYFADIHNIAVQRIKSKPENQNLSDDELQRQLSIADVTDFDGITQIPYNMLQSKFQEKIDSFSGTHDVDIKGLDSKIMFKSAKHLKSLANDFQGLDLRNIESSDPNKGGIAKEAVMDANSVTRKVRINKDFYAPGTKVASARRRHGKFGFVTANDNYSLVHEAGHITNYAIKDKLNATANAQPGGQRNPYRHHDPVARGILADALVSHSSKDKKLRSLLIKHAGLDKKAKFDDPNTAKLISQALDAPIVNGQRQPNKLLKALYKKGYTSKYGSSSPVEMYAEAFGDYYHNKAKEEKYDKEGRERKLRHFRKDRNILSDDVISRSKELFDDNNVDARKKFLDIYG